VADIVCLHDKDEVERFTRRNPYLHLYAIGDLDDFFWPHTLWYALRQDGQVRELILVYTGQLMPVVLALSADPAGPLRELLRGLLPLLPRRFYAHLSAGVADVSASDYAIECHGAFCKMALTDRTRLAAIDMSSAVPLGAAAEAELAAFFAVSYPGNWFVPRMLQTGFYFGVRRGPALASVAGVHTVSRRYRVAAVGNIATHPDFRGQGLATSAVARLCQELFAAGMDHIGLNVRIDNASAIACYEKLGFQRIADYGEYTLQLK